MGKMLIKGWAMCAEVCDDCQYPLFRDRSTKNLICVSCQGQLGNKLVEGHKLEEIDGKSTIKIDGKLRTVTIVNKVMKLAPEQLEEVKEVP